MVRINERQMRHMMKKMGMKTREIEAEEVYIKGITADYQVINPQITIVEVQGQQVLQIMGAIKEIKKEQPLYTEEDLEIVITQTGVSRDEAIKALKNANGKLAEAIIALKSR